MSEVTELIQAFRNGELSLEEVAQRFRERDWPRRRHLEPATYLEMAAASERDPEPDVPGSFDEVYAALDRRELTDDQFQVLQDAALEGMGKGDQTSSD